MKRDEVPAFKKFIAHKDGATNKELKKNSMLGKQKILLEQIVDISDLGIREDFL